MIYLKLLVLRNFQGYLLQCNTYSCLHTFACDCNHNHSCKRVQTHALQSIHISKSWLNWSKDNDMKRQKKCRRRSFERTEWLIKLIYFYKFYQEEYWMNSKRNKIFLLKEKLTEMQNELTVLQKGDLLRGSLSPKRNIQGIQQQARSRNRQFKSPTFWGQNPINNSSQYSPCRRQITPSPINRNERIKNAERESSPVLKNIINTVDQNYYNSVTQYRQKESHELQYYYESAYSGKRYENTLFGLTRFTPPKESNVKMFDKKRTDTIVNPEHERISSKKIVKNIQRSPDKMLTDNPKSNPNMYFIGNKTVVISRKGSMQDKNKSNILLAHSNSQAFVPSLTQAQKKRKRSQKKHFSKYFQDTLTAHF